jgi:hypothetical protein
LLDSLDSLRQRSCQIVILLQERNESPILRMSARLSTETCSWMAGMANSQFQLEQGSSAKPSGRARMVRRRVRPRYFELELKLRHHPKLVDLLLPSWLDHVEHWCARASKK